MSPKDLYPKNKNINKLKKFFKYLKRRLHNSRKAAKDAARKHGQGKPEHHTAHGKGQRNHWHATDKNVNKLTGSENVHYECGPKR